MLRSRHFLSFETNTQIGERWLMVFPGCHNYSGPAAKPTSGLLRAYTHLLCFAAPALGQISAGGFRRQNLDFADRNFLWP
jgi:hypothetical protein